MSVDYGTDVSTYMDGDLDPTFSNTCTGEMLVAETVARIWETDVGTLDDAPDVGGGLWGFLSAPVRAVAAIAASLKNQAETDERVQTCDVRVSLRDDVLAVSGLITPSQSAPFRLVLSIDQVSNNPKIMVG